MPSAGSPSKTETLGSPSDVAPSPPPPKPKELTDAQNQWWVPAVKGGKMVKGPKGANLQLSDEDAPDMSCPARRRQPITPCSRSESCQGHPSSRGSSREDKVAAACGDRDSARLTEVTTNRVSLCGTQEATITPHTGDSSVPPVTLPETLLSSGGPHWGCGKRWGNRPQLEARLLAGGTPAPHPPPRVSKQPGGAAPAAARGALQCGEPLRPPCSGPRLSPLTSPPRPPGQHRHHETRTPPPTTLEGAPRWSSERFPGRLLSPPPHPARPGGPGPGAGRCLSREPSGTSSLPASAHASSSLNSLGPSATPSSPSKAHQSLLRQRRPSPTPGKGFLSSSSEVPERFRFILRS